MLRSVLLVLPLVLAAGWFAESANAHDDPVELIRQTTGELFSLLEDNRGEYEENPDLLRAEIERVLLPAVDRVHSARLVLGRHGRGQSREDIEAFADALTDALLSRYATGLLQFRSREQVEILPLTGDNTERQTRVRTRIRLDSGSRAPVDYVLHFRNDRWQIFDVIVEGISYVATFRNQIGEEIRRSSFEDVLNRLQSGELDIDIEDNG